MALRRMRPDPARGLLVIFVFVYVFFLSQASVFRATLGYGGAIFVALWLSLRIRLVPEAVAARMARAGAIGQTS
jgi:hypothetical protein